MSAGGRRVAGVLGILVALALATPAAAEIREVDRQGRTLTVKASSARDVIDVTAGRKTIKISDRDGISGVSARCSGLDDLSPDETYCDRENLGSVIVDLGDGEDSFDGDGTIRFEVDGGSENDEVDGGNRGDLLEGKLGDDRIDGSEGGDEILGGLDDDVLAGKGGRDLLDGGPGVDKGDGGAGKDKCIGVERASKRGCS